MKEVEHNDGVGFGEMIRSIRVSNCMTLKHVAGRLGITQVYLSDVELSKRPPFNEERIIELASIYGCDKWELIKLAAIDKGIIVIYLDRISADYIDKAMEIYKKAIDNLRSE